MMHGEEDSREARELRAARRFSLWREVLVMAATAASIYTAIRVDLAELRTRVEYSVQQADRANARLDELRFRGER